MKKIIFLTIMAAMALLAYAYDDEGGYSDDTGILKRGTLSSTTGASAYEKFKILTIGDSNARETWSVGIWEDTSAYEVTRIHTSPDSKDSLFGKSFHIDSILSNFFVWFDTKSNAAEFIKVPAGHEEARVYLARNDTAVDVARKLTSRLDAYNDFSATQETDNVVVTHTKVGNVAHPSMTGTASNFKFYTQTNGAQGLNNRFFYLNDTNDSLMHIVWYDVASSGTIPDINLTKARVQILSGYNSISVAINTKTAIDSLFTGTFITSRHEDLLQITNRSYGPATDMHDRDTGFNFYRIQNGSDGGNLDGKSFAINSYCDSVASYVWFDRDNSSTDPEVIDRTGIEVDIKTGSTFTQVAREVAKQLESQSYITANWTGGREIDVTMDNACAVTDPYDIDSGTSFLMETSGVTPDYVVVPAMSCANIRSMSLESVTLSSMSSPPVCRLQVALDSSGTYWVNTTLTITPDVEGGVSKLATPVDIAAKMCRVKCDSAPSAGSAYIYMVGRYN